MYIPFVTVASSRDLSVFQRCVFVLCAVVTLVAVSVVVPQSAQAKTNYPLLSLYFVDCCFTNEEAKDIAKFDLVILTMEAAEYNASGIAEVRRLNPNIKILPYVPSQGVVLQYPSATRQKLINKIQPDWYLVRTDGSYVSRYTGEYGLNITRSDVRGAIADFVGQDLNKAMCGGVRCWDGVFYDVVEDNVTWLGALDFDRNGFADTDVNTKWVASYVDLFARTRSQIGNDKLIIINGVSNLDVQTTVNGRMFEHFPTPWHADGSWKGVAENVPTLDAKNMNPTGIIFSAQGDQNDYKRLRFSIVSGLISGTYAGYDNGVDKHNTIWIYDEYKSNLGEARGAAVNLKDKKNKTWKAGVWRRDFDNGVALINTTSSSQTVSLDSGYEHLNGTQDKKVNSGELTGKVTIPANDGMILLKRSRQMDNAPFLNGSFASIYSLNGTKSRTSFFPFERGISGNTMVKHIPSQGVKVVAGRTYVEVYKKGKRTAKFAPYGTKFTGGVQIDVDSMIPETASQIAKNQMNPIRIVTGTRSGGKHVKIYDLNGKVKNGGCFPFGKNGSEGIDVAIGDVLRKNKGKEIVVTQSRAGSSRVLILNGSCKVVNKGFDAYDSKMRKGVSVAVGNLDSTPGEEIVTMPGPGASSHVRIFTEKNPGQFKSVNKGFFAFDKSNKAGGDIAVADLNFDGINEIIPMTLGVFNF